MVINNKEIDRRNFNSANLIRFSFLSLCIILVVGANTARADDVFHATGEIFACVNPRATKALSNREDPRQRDSKWVQFVIHDGRCFAVKPGDTWEQISDRDGMKLLRREPPIVGMPPLYFLPFQVMPGAAPKMTPEQVPEASSSGDDPTQSENSPVFPAGPVQSKKSLLEKDNNEDPHADAGVTGEEAVAAPPLPQQTELSIKTQETDTGGGSLFTFMLVGVVGVVVFGLWKKSVANKRIKEAWRIVVSEIERQGNALQIRKMQLATPDHYGTVNLARWQKEINYFCESRLQTVLSGAGLLDQWPLISAQAAQRVDAVASSAPRSTIPPRFVSDPRTFDPRMDPIDYERHCALLLQQAGWDARVTQASGDQGADVIAERLGRKVVVQCKLYSQPVGNKAVQEAFAAKQHQGADLALVATNAEFTPSARQLASTTGVLLLHHSQLAQFRM